VQRIMRPQNPSGVTMLCFNSHTARVAITSRSTRLTAVDRVLSEPSMRLLAADLSYVIGFDVAQEECLADP
jgi:hypothetical protein